MTPQRLQPSPLCPQCAHAIHVHLGKLWGSCKMLHAARGLDAVFPRVAASKVSGVLTRLLCISSRSMEPSKAYATSLFTVLEAWCLE
jgi:hypothetical protein